MTVDASLAPVARAAAADRLERLRASLRDADIDAAILFDSINLRYACDARNMQLNTGRNPGRYVFVPADGPVVLFEYAGCEHLAANLDTVDEIRPAHALYPLYTTSKYQRHLDRFLGDIADLLGASETERRRVAIDRPTTEMVPRLQAAGFDVVDATAALDSARCIKTTNELELIRASVRCTELAVAELEHHLVPGRTEQEVWAQMHRKLVEEGGEYIETRLFTSGPHTNPWFQETSGRRIGDGELVALDTDAIGCFGYYTDFSRTFLCGDRPPTATQRRLYGQAAEMLEHNIALIAAGVGFREFSERAWPVPEPYLPHRYLALAHGNGFAGEFPVIRHLMDWDEVGDDGVFEAGMTICVEAFIGHVDGGEGVKLEEQVLVTDRGIERLSTYGYDDRLG